MGAAVFIYALAPRVEHGNMNTWRPVSLAEVGRFSFAVLSPACPPAEWELAGIVKKIKRYDFAYRLIEISENLHRAELTALERAKLVAEWVELTEEKVGQVAQVYGGRGNKEGISEASRQLGVERTEVRRALKVASLSPEAQDAAREVGLDDNRSACRVFSTRMTFVSSAER